MGKGPPPPANLERYARVVAERIRRSKVAKPDLRCLSSVKEEAAAIAASSRGIRRRMDETKMQEGRVPLKDVVADCTRRWFQDTLKEARAGDAGMQVLVGQMYQSGYGVSKNEQKANAWISRASKYRSSVWKVSDKRPGYNASDSDSDEEKINIKSSAEGPGS
ncbi:uncharacterized protein LOC122016159 [Zingiber officinale]|uniref:Uncharacterized protein n=1 Tax=Zingiber officinale TaxID=94328 RepID=A0A8J5IHS5_ZINOF|nr:uncharacterized protein LOC122016159 [Zingiber officinale]KAG6535325.1 hypothetical protein ZIOFF_000290 [Zingiber officinale]